MKQVKQYKYLEATSDEYRNLKTNMNKSIQVTTKLHHAINKTILKRMKMIIYKDGYGIIYIRVNFKQQRWDT